MNKLSIEQDISLLEAFVFAERDLVGKSQNKSALDIRLVESYYERPWIMSESAYGQATSIVEGISPSCFEHAYVTKVLGLKVPLLEGGRWPREFEKRIIQEQLLMEGFFSDLFEKGKEKLMDAAEGVKTFGKEAWHVLKGFYLAVKEGKGMSLASSLWKKAIKPIFSPLMNAFEWMTTKFPDWGLNKLASGAQKGLDLLKKIQDKIKSVKGWKAVTLFSGVAVGLKWLWNEIGDWIEKLKEKTGNFADELVSEGETTSQKVAGKVLDAGAEKVIEWIKESGKEMIKKLIGPALMEKITKLAAEVTVSGWWKAAKAVGKGAALVIDSIGSAVSRFVGRDETAKKMSASMSGQNEAKMKRRLKVTRSQIRDLILEVSGNDPQSLYKRLLQLKKSHGVYFSSIKKLGEGMYADLVDLLSEMYANDPSYSGYGEFLKIARKAPYGLYPEGAYKMWFGKDEAGASNPVGNALDALELFDEYQSLKDQFENTKATSQEDRVYGRKRTNVVHKPTGTVVSSSTNRKGSLGGT